MRKCQAGFRICHLVLQLRLATLREGTSELEPTLAAGGNVHTWRSLLTGSPDAQSMPRFSCLQDWSLGQPGTNMEILYQCMGVQTAPRLEPRCQ
jgi:hypothetical protein